MESGWEPPAPESTPDDPSLPARRHLVRITEFERARTRSALSGRAGSVYPVAWTSEATPFEMLLEATAACVNILRPGG